MNDTGKVLTALAAGFAVGAITGILFAPDKGSETRHKIAEKGREFSDAVRDKVHAGKEKVTELRDKIRGTAADIKEQLS